MVIYQNIYVIDFIFLRQQLFHAKTAKYARKER